jgi:PAS domain S-box-containing protein
MMNNKDLPYRFVNIILDSIADGVFTVDMDFKITSFNRAAERITLVSREEAIGKYCFDVFHANICQTGCALKKTMETGKEIIDLPVNIVNQEGKTIPVSISAALLRDEKGKIVGGVETFRDLSAIEAFKKEILKRYTVQDIISKNHVIQKIFAILPDIAESDSTVLIQGPSGSGKELFARAIHNLSQRKKGSYIVVNCGALPDTLLESELFGYMKGAFTGATRDKAGRISLAEGGTLFLDEVAELSLPLQVKLLRFLQEKEYDPLGAVSTLKADVRIITATNRDLTEQKEKGKFREDLYYRLNVIKIELPPLSERREDIPLLLEHFITTFNLKMYKRIIGVSDEVMNVLMHYSFPGNVRELQNIIEHAFVLCRDSIIELRHLPQEIKQKAETIQLQPSSPSEKLRQIEVRLIKEALQRHNGNRAKTAQELGIDKSTLWRKMKKYNITEF